MRKFLSTLLLVACLMLMALTRVNAQGTKQVILMFTEGQSPQIAKMPQYAYQGMQPLTKEDKVLDAVEFEAKGKNIYHKVIEFYFKAMSHFLKSNRFILPDKMRMLVIVKNENKAFSLSGNVSANFSNSVSNNSTLNTSATLANPVYGSASKNVSDTLSSSGGIFPSYSKSWSDQKFEIWFLLCE